MMSGPEVCSKNMSIAANQGMHKNAKEEINLTTPPRTNLRDMGVT
jgi:hypothetical protein